ncbi:hypothetical protein A3I99_04215 [Candidatus Kaiserbacteria bacterium RIFCSPLOWO2_02_FULL_45_11b]|uniref:DUF4332 domain-containing protein n=1 Tax=Candidatus Kaiserbacteria bacterium RIFCSPLOWO2_12_FULL_45_26 TaxID=1798525 RepID=A0A1F6FHF6_9BACT|nr:MAG: hypothetical protein A2929_03430 [Candidatus Kaiserbacteria bacterium RIFCSPLOWO2_01_FULL_45_25]OGG83787.1 MAG: hypothetical protein A3I99_04215 [Candidatus Kaiserbacteria bacterium RIFCSPLOWO2_02_FULL_45_11b]OGG85283.1 MAG: hypothetical protein A3G90_04490 [Candidatus Kaiserbacteria bacterium RIFCSPLOWO2_12_FULL_45_26]
MNRADSIHESGELSLEFTKILTQAGITKFKALAKYTRFGLRTKIPKLKVRHLANLEWSLKIRGLDFVPDFSIRLDDFINQRKLFNLWKQGVYTYQELDRLPFEKFVEAMGGPQSRFFRNKSAAKQWVEKNKLSNKKRLGLPHLTQTTAELLYKGGIGSLNQLAKKPDLELAKILQPGFGTTKTALKLLTRARLVEIKYALYKDGIDRPCMPL